MKKLKQPPVNGYTGGFGGRGRGKGSYSQGRGRFQKGPDRRQVNAIGTTVEELTEKLEKLEQWVEMPTVNMIGNFYDYQLVGSADRGPTPTPLYVTTNWTTGYPDFQPVPIMVDSGAAVYCVLGLEISRSCQQKDWYTMYGARKPTYVSNL